MFGTKNTRIRGHDEFAFSSREERLERLQGSWFVWALSHEPEFDRVEVEIEGYPLGSSMSHRTIRGHILRGR